MSAMLGWWFHRLQSRRAAEAGLEGRKKWITLAPAFVVLGLCAALFVWGAQIVSYFGVFPQQEDLARDMFLSYGSHFVIAAVAVLAILRWRQSKNLMKILLGVLSADVVVFLIFSATALFGGSGPTEPSAQNAQAVLGSAGRTALVDQGGAHQLQFRALGVPNMNVFTKRQSVQGYGSLISTNYDNSTGTHPQAAIDACRLADGTFAQLRLATLVVASGQLSHNVIVPVPKSPNCRQAPATTTAYRYFGQMLHVSTLTVHGRGGRLVTSGVVTLTMLGANGRSDGVVERARGANVMTFAVPVRVGAAAGFELRSTSTVSIGDAEVTQLSPAKVTYEVDSPLQEALDSSQWRLASTEGTFSVFKAVTVKPTMWLENPSLGTLSHVKNTAYGDSWVDVRATSALTLVRSMAYLPGWRAVALNRTSGKSVALKLTNNGLIQQVAVPQGEWTIHFHYHAPYIGLGLTASTVGVASVIGVGAYLIVDERRRREDKVRS
jgi:hypothetical protein